MGSPVGGPSFLQHAFGQEIGAVPRAREACAGNGRRALTAVLWLACCAAPAGAHDVHRTGAACGEARDSIHACVDARGISRIVNRHTPCRRTDIRALHWTEGGPVYVFGPRDGGFEK